MRTTLAAIAAGRLFQAPALQGNAPSNGAGVPAYAEPYVGQEQYVQYAPVHPYTVMPAPMRPASPSPMSAAMVVLFGLAVGVTAAKRSKHAALATMPRGKTDEEIKQWREKFVTQHDGYLTITVDPDLQVSDVPWAKTSVHMVDGVLKTDESTTVLCRAKPKYRKNVDADGKPVSTALEKELERAGIDPSEFEGIDLKAPHHVDWNKSTHPGHEAIQIANKQWFIVDATNMRLGRMATEIARRLIGKHKPHFYPGADVGDMVIVVNAEKVYVTGKKKDQKLYRRHSGRPGSMKIESFRELQARIPERIVQKAVWGMLPKNSFGRELFRHLKVYAGPDHPHAAQQPVEMEWAYKDQALAPDKMRADFLPGATATTPEQEERAKLALLPKEDPNKDQSTLYDMSPEEQEVYDNMKRILGPEGSPDMMDWLTPRGPHAALAVGGSEIPEMSLTNLKPLKGSWHRRKRKGRGISAGQGKTCGFGENGQKARSGRSVHYNTRPDGSRVKFAGGQNTRFNAGSLKDHHRGFGPGHKYTKYSLIHLRDLNGLPDGSEVSFQDLITKGMVQKSSKRPLKKIVDGFGLTAKNITIKTHGVTKAARDAIEKNGGKVVLLTKNNKVISEKEQEKKVVAALAIHGWGIEGYKVTRKTKPRKKRHLRVRKKVSGTPERPRLCVFRSNQHMYAQIIDDSALDRFGYKSGKILCGASTLSAELKHVHEGSGVGTGGANKAAATLVGHLIAEKAKAFNVEKVVFDRAGYKYHGRVAAVADGAREKGLVF